MICTAGTSFEVPRQKGDGDLSEFLDGSKNGFSFQARKWNKISHRKQLGK
ncbi:hypothetical protein SAMN05444380_10795 [Thermophagus xiamenensis]|uniref:Uncharacterized protein n=1 Tax=Thermophagus xiamenensis TaxID=385682 RepID=A0A1I1Y6P7_9BACT|nr:hypothetical protein SAMN05444380_10795 [Thermophagus xiamenensis]